MKVFKRVGLRKALGVGAVAVLVSTGAASMSPAQAARGSVSAGSAICLPGDATAARTRGPDHNDLTRAEAAAVDRDLRSKLSQRRTTALPTTITIKVRVHAIQGNHRGEYITRDRIDKQMAVLNKAYSGGFSTASAKTRFKFSLYSIDRRKNETWFHTPAFSAAEQTMKRTLYKGSRAHLNLYLRKPNPTAAGQILGWATFPWEWSSHPKLDGVVINSVSMPGGVAKDYNLGMTGAHEVGHWLGLLHTFENGCDSPGDYVNDTPAEAEAHLGCDPTADTCTAPGTDPVHNFMDYSFDSCMNQFTAGQSTRLDQFWQSYRLR